MPCRTCAAYRGLAQYNIPCMSLWIVQYLCSSDPTQENACCSNKACRSHGFQPTTWYIILGHPDDIDLGSVSPKIHRSYRSDGSDALAVPSTRHVLLLYRCNLYKAPRFRSSITSRPIREANRKCHPITKPVA